MTREEFLMEKTRLIKDLEKRYIKESGIIDSNYLCWLEEIDRDGKVVAEWVDVFKVRSASVERGHIFIDSVDIGHISVDHSEDEGDVYNLVEFEKNDPETRCGITISPESGDVRIDDEDYSRILDILYGGDSDVSPKQRFELLEEFLNRCGYNKKTV
jgi:hypothetical protein